MLNCPHGLITPFPEALPNSLWLAQPNTVQPSVSAYIYICTYALNIYLRIAIPEVTRGAFIEEVTGVLTSHQSSWGTTSLAIGSLISPLGWRATLWLLASASWGSTRSLSWFRQAKWILDCIAWGTEI